MRRLSVALFLALFFVGLPVVAQTPPLKTAQAESDPLDAALDHIYNLEYDEAGSILETWLKQHPNDLAALNTLAQAILDKEMLREGLFSSALYINNAEGLRKLRPSFPASLGKQLEEILGKAQTLAHERLKVNPQDQDALFWGAVTHRTRAEFDLVVAHYYLAGFHEGRAAYKHAARLWKLNPHYVDALFVVGLYDYAAGSLPWYARVFAVLAGLHGSRARGLAELKRVSEDGHWARVDAQVSLIVLYRNEKMYPEALAALENLERSYPRDFVLRLEMADIRTAQGDWRAAAQLDDALLQKLRAAHTPSAEVILPQALYHSGSVHEHLGEMDQTLKLYEEAADRADNEPIGYRARLAAADLYRRLGRRREALRDYQRVASAAPDTVEGRAARQALLHFE